MAKAKTVAGNQRHEPTPKGTSIGDGRIKMASMNKRKKANFKKYRGQGR